jgi:hypothetical protein
VHDIHLAAALLAAAGPVHSVLGERYIIVPLLRSTELSNVFGRRTVFTSRVIRAGMRHVPLGTQQLLTSVAWWGCSAILWRAGSGTLSGPGAVSIVGSTFMASSLLVLALTRGRHLAWVLFLSVGAIALNRS